MNRKIFFFCFLWLCGCGYNYAQSPYIQAVDEYVPAPGQFVNKLPEITLTDNAQSAAQKCTDAIAQGRKGLITLGAFGGYITFHFDHPIVNMAGANDIKIMGNAIAGASEPGIVMVSQDENQNGLPDDTWYELSGSADTDSIGKVTYNYSITYTKQGDKKEIKWQDGQGGSGVIPRNDWHTQEYFPLWLGNSLTFKGTRLPNNGYDRSGNGTYWVLNALESGYVDNLADANLSVFNIDNAVDDMRRPVILHQIDFVRVYTALNQVCGWLGESSTEISGAEDLHPTATQIDNVSGLRSEVKTIYDISGKVVPKLQKGINIVRYADGTIRKVVKR